MSTLTPTPEDFRPERFVKAVHINPDALDPEYLNGLLIISGREGRYGRIPNPAIVVVPFVGQFTDTRVFACPRSASAGKHSCSSDALHDYC